jgi:hypothetical protein
LSFAKIARKRKKSVLNLFLFLSLISIYGVLDTLTGRALRLEQRHLLSPTLALDWGTGVTFLEGRRCQAFTEVEAGRPTRWADLPL